MSKELDSEPVLLVFATDKVLIHAGDPKTFDQELLDEYISSGFTLTTITIGEYRANNITLYNTKMFIDFSTPKTETV